MIAHSQRLEETWREVDTMDNVSIDNGRLSSFFKVLLKAISQSVRA